MKTCWGSRVSRYRLNRSVRQATSYTVDLMVQHCASTVFNIPDSEKHLTLYCSISHPLAMFLRIIIRFESNSFSSLPSEYTGYCRSISLLLTEIFREYCRRRVGYWRSPAHIDGPQPACSRHRRRAELGPRASDGKELEDFTRRSRRKVDGNDLSQSTMPPIAHIKPSSCNPHESSVRL
jgi:hypothetical protein